MSRETEILELLRSVNPAPPAEDEIDLFSPTTALPHLPSTLEVRGGDRWRESGWGPLGMAAAFLIVVTGLALFWAAESPGPISGLSATYSGSLIRDGGPGEADVRHMVSLEISDTGAGLSGVLIHGAPGMSTLDQDRQVVMPVTVSLSDQAVEVHWEPSLGEYEDTTLEQCRWQGWSLTFERPDADGLLNLSSGSISGRPPEGPDVGEFLSGCPSGERQVLSLVLAPR